MAPLTLLSRKNDRGQAVIEMALTLPLLLLVVFGIFDFGFMFQRYEIVTNAAREGARVGVLPDFQVPLTSGRMPGEQRALDYLAAGGIGPYTLRGCGGAETPRTACVQLTTSTVTIAGSSPPQTVQQVTVIVEYDHEHSFVGPILRLFGGNMSTVRLRAASSMRKE